MESRLPDPRDVFTKDTLIDSRYRVVEQLGAGGMAVVFLVRNERLKGRKAVLKAPFPGPTFRAEDLLARFEGEISNLIDIGHMAGVVDIVDHGVHRDAPFYVAEYMAGGSLQDQLGPEGRQAATEVLAWLRPMAQALDSIHRAGLVHRDVKPDNILFTDQGQARMADFGIARVLDAGTSGTTSAYTRIGTQAYLAPEQEAGLPVDGRADQFGLAATAYRALTGRPPATRGVAKGVRGFAPSVSDACGAAIDRALDPDRDKRFPTCAAFLEAFACGIVRAPDRQTSRRTRPVASTAAAEARKRSRTKPRSPSSGKFVVLALLLAGLACGALWYFSRDKVVPSTTPPMVADITSPATGEWLRSSAVPVRGTASGTSQVQVNGAVVPVTAGKFSTTVDGSTDGDAVLRVTDGEGNVLSERTVRVDTQPPVIRITEPTEETSISTASVVQVRGTVDEANLDALQVNGVALTPDAAGRFTWPVTLVEDKPTTLRFEARDRAGNEAVATSRTITFRVPVAPWQAHLAKTEKAGRAGDWRTAQSHYDAALTAGIPESSLPAWLVHGVTRWRSQPDLTVKSPSDGAQVATGTIQVSGVFTTYRSDDRVYVNGTKVQDAHALPSRGQQVVAFTHSLEVTTTGPLPLTIEVRDGQEVRASRTLRLEAKVDWLDFLADWAKPVGTELDPATGYPKRIRRSKDGAEMLLVPAGTFWMGRMSAVPTENLDWYSDKKDWPRHRVTLTRSYYLDVFEITNDRFGQFVSATSYVTEVEREGGTMYNEGGPTFADKISDWRKPWPKATIKKYIRDRGKHPVVKVTWADAVAYATWAGVSLPTEAQFERALRAGKEGIRYPWGNGAPPRVVENLLDLAYVRKNGSQSLVDPKKLVWYDDGFPLTAPVGSFEASAWGFHDLNGNVMEWCLDVWYEFGAAHVTDPVGKGTLNKHVLRGGDWMKGVGAHTEPVSSLRNGLGDSGWTHGVGFRCAITLP